MFFVRILIGILAGAVAVAGAGCDFDAAAYSSSIQLSADINYMLYHKVEGDRLFIALAGDTGGYLGFGLAEQASGGMAGADIVTVFVDDDADDALMVQDRWVDWVASDYPEPTSGYFPTEDAHNDWKIEGYSEVDGRTTVELSRALDTGDEQDRAVLSGSRRIIWAYGPDDFVSYHGASRGQTRVTFYGEDDVALPEHDDTYSFQFSSYHVPAQVTTYSCQSFLLPIDRRRHVVAIAPILSADTTNRPHHAILHVCSNDTYWRSQLEPGICGRHPGDEYGWSPLGDPDSGCASLAWVWAPGSDRLVFPEDVGLPIGPDVNDVSHVILEIHFDNPTLRTDRIDETGFTLYTVDRGVRTHDAGVIVVGDPVVQLGIDGPLRAGHGHNHREAECPSACTSDFAEPVHVFSSFLHMHSFGEKMYSNLYHPDGSFQQVTNRVDYWSFGDQHDTPVSFDIAPGSRLHTHCFYDTSKSSADISFGAGSADEMCMEFLFYYPRQYRGVTTSGDPSLFAMCGLLDNEEGGKITICGSGNQADSGFELNHIQQRDPDGFATYRDPTSFGTVNLAAGGFPASGQGCGAPAPSPSATPTASPPAPVPTAIPSQREFGAIRFSNVDFDRFIVDVSQHHHFRRVLTADIAQLIQAETADIHIMGYRPGSLVVDLVVYGEASEELSAHLAALSRESLPLTRDFFEGGDGDVYREDHTAEVPLAHTSPVVEDGKGGNGLTGTDGAIIAVIIVVAVAAVAFVSLYISRRRSHDEPPAAGRPAFNHLDEAQEAP